MIDLDRSLKETLQDVASRFEPPPPSLIEAVHQRGRVLRARAIATTLIAVLVLTSAAVLIARAIDSNQPGSLIGPGHQDPNYSIAKAEVRHLVQLLNLPPGSTEVSRAPTEELSTEELSTGPSRNTSNFVSATAWWTVPASVDSTISWIVQHPPAALTLLGSQGTVSSPKYVLHLIDFQGNGAQAYQDVALEISVEKVLGHAVVRVDGKAVWLTSTVTRDVPRPALRVTVAGGCPNSLGRYQDISNPPSHDLTLQLLPSALPTSAIRCRYHESAIGRTSRYQLVLGRVDTLDASNAQRVARAVRNLPLGSPGSVVTTAPVCGGSLPVFGLALERLTTEIIVFSFPGRADIDVWHDTLCGAFVDNGYITTVAPIGSLG
jgi:hypothetical protein